MNNFQLFLLFLCLKFSFVCAQVEGFVFDNQKEPVGGVSVFFVDQNMLLETNQDGVFLIDEVVRNNSHIEFSKLGYKSKVIQYTSGQEIKILLEKIHIELDEIGISETVTVLGDNRIVNIEKTSLKDNFISSTSMVYNISKIPGVHSIGSGLAIEKIAIRALSGMRVSTYFNGVKIENQQWANDHGIGFTDLGIYELELIKGASALKLGAEGVGGILYFKDYPFVQSKVPTGYVATKFDHNHFLFGNQFGLRWSRKNLFMNLYGQYDVASDYKLPDNTYLFNSRFKNTAVKFSSSYVGENIQSILRYQYNNSELGLPAHVHGDLQSVDLSDITLNSISIPEDFESTRPTQISDNHLFVFENNYFSSKSHYSFIMGHFINNLQEWERWTYPGIDMSLITSTAKFNMKTNFNSFIINIGGQVERQTNTNNTDVTLLIPNSESNNLGIYSTLDFNRDKFGFNAGLRFDNKSIECIDKDYSNSFYAFSSSLGVFFQHIDHLIRFTYSSSFRAPHLSELFSNGVHHGTNRYEIGDQNLKLEKGYQFDVKYQWSNEHVGFVVNPFVQIINNFISISPTETYQDSYKVYDYNQFDKIQISGLEANFHFHPHLLHNLHIEQSYTFLNTKNHDTNSVLAMTPANQIKTTVNYRFDNVDFILMPEMLSIYFLYSFEQDKVVEHERSTDSYSLLNMELLLNPFKNIMLNVGVNNILNTEYVPHLSRIKEVGQSGVPHPGRSINLSLKYDF